MYGKRTYGREGRITLRGEDEGLHHGSERQRQQNGEREEEGNLAANGGEGTTQRRAAREVDAEALWE